MNELTKTAIKIFDNTLQSITGAQTVGKAESSAQLARGYLVGIRLLDIINNWQYDAMSDLLEISVKTARKQINKATSGVTSTESGFVQRNLTNTNSIAIFAISVNKEGAGYDNE